VIFYIFFKFQGQILIIVKKLKSLALRRTKRQYQHLANYMYLHLHFKILKDVERARMQQSKRNFLQKSVGVRFGVG
jgi:hypothetical protein